MRPLYPPDKLMMDFAAGEMLVLAQVAHPIIIDRILYWKDHGLAGLWDGPRISTPETKPARAPKAAAKSQKSAALDAQDRNGA